MEQVRFELVLLWATSIISEGLTHATLNTIPIKHFWKTSSVNGFHKASMANRDNLNLRPPQASLDLLLELLGQVPGTQTDLRANSGQKLAADPCPPGRPGRAEPYFVALRYRTKSATMSGKRMMQI